jgi:hypothetical protein
MRTRLFPFGSRRVRFFVPCAILGNLRTVVALSQLLLCRQGKALEADPFAILFNVKEATGRTRHHLSITSEGEHR